RLTAATTSCPAAVRLATAADPISPVAPVTNTRIPVLSDRVVRPTQPASRTRRMAAIDSPFRRIPTLSVTRTFREFGMPCIVAVAQRKGGVGKTTLAVSIAAELSARANLVALVDTDPQRSASEWARPGLLGFPVYGMDLGDGDVSFWARGVRAIG